MHPIVEQQRIRQAEPEMRRAAAPVDVAIRAAEDRDVPALLRLAALDSQPLPGGTLLVAEAGGAIRATLAVESGVVVADPFVATAPLQALLRLRADQLRRERRGAAHRVGLLSALHLRMGRAG